MSNNGLRLNLVHPGFWHDDGDGWVIGLKGFAYLSRSSIEIVLRENTKRLISLPGVVGTGQGMRDGMPCITVYVVRKTSVLANQIPDRLEEFPVFVEEIGEIKSRDANESD